MKHGPVDVIILGTGEPRFDGSILTELEQLAAAGTIRVLDAMLLVKADEGTAITLDIEDLGPADKASLGFIETGTRGLFDSEDADELIEGMVPGSAVLALAIEHAWAAGLATALWDAGAEVAFTTRIPAPIVDEALAALAAGE